MFDGLMTMAIFWGFCAEPRSLMLPRSIALYGLLEAPQAWSHTLVSFLTDYGFKSVNNFSMFLTWSDAFYVFCVFYVWLIYFLQ
jgi:hypothetical protein